MAAAVKPEPVRAWDPDDSQATKIAKEQALRNRVIGRLASAGFGCSGEYGEEVALYDVAHSENYDVVTGQGLVIHAYKSTCAPAAMSRCGGGIVVPTPPPTPPPTPTPTPTPGPTPTPTPTPGPSPSPTCTFTRADFLAKGVMFSVQDTTAPGQPRINFDSTAKVCDQAKCTAVGFPPDQRCCPNFPEGSTRVPPAFAAQCDITMTTPRVWHLSGGEYCNQGGEQGLDTNPMRNCAKQGGSGTIAHASGSACRQTRYPCKGAACQSACPAEWVPGAEAGGAAPGGVAPPSPTGGSSSPSPEPTQSCPTVFSIVIDVSGGEPSGPHGGGAPRYALHAATDPRRACVSWKAFDGNIQGEGNDVSLFVKSGHVNVQACAYPAGHPCASVKR